ncbi:MAG: hypothetical protein LBQ55_11215 [Treponema sp.]|jgi:hypothetical protein|nr:hypothetical protein [Treponema sp.]
MEKEKKPVTEPVFYYSRARRLERASPAVRALNSEIPGKRPSLFRTLTANKANSMILAAIVLLSGVMAAASFLMSRDDTVLGGNAVALSALRYNGSTIVILKKSVKTEKGVYTGAVDMAVSPAAAAGGSAAADGSSAAASAEENPLAVRRIFFTLEKNEEYRVSVPFEAPELLILLRAEEKQVSLKIKPE